MKILVTGAGGQLGRAMARRLSSRHEVVALGLLELDLRDAAAVRQRVLAERPGAIVNCAAYTDVDGAESAPVEALTVNAMAVRSLTRSAAETGAALVHFSTDFVFDGEASAPYSEDDPPNPRSTYACSKLIGEWFAQEWRTHYVLRVESLFGALPDPPDSRRTSVDKIVDAILRGEEARVFHDRTVSPSYTEDVSAATQTLLEGGLPGGLYHCVNTGHCSWYELGVEVARQVGKAPRLLAVSVADVPLTAARPRFCALSNAKLARIGVTMPSWQDALGRYLRHRGSVGVAAPRREPGPPA